MITAAFVALVQWYIGWSTLLAPWRTVSLAELAGAALLFFGCHVLRGLRVHSYFGPATRGRWPTCIRVALLHNLVNSLLPMRTGELVFPVLMRRRFGVSVARSMGALAWFRLLDLHALGLLALAALHGLYPDSREALLLAVIWLPIPILVRRLGSALIARADDPGGGHVMRLARALAAGFPGSPALFWSSLLWTLAVWTVKLTAFAWVLVLLAPMRLANGLLGAIGGELSSALPVHGLAGMGTYEAGVVAGLTSTGLGPEAMLAAALNLHLFVLGVTLVSGGAALLVGWPGNRGPVPGAVHRSDVRE